MYIYIIYIFQLLDEMSREIDELRKYKTAAETREGNAQSGIAHLQTNEMNRGELEAHIINLKQVSLVKTSLFFY